MIMKYDCECGTVHSSKINKLIIVESGVVGVSEIIRKIIRAGTVNIIACVIAEDYARGLKLLMEKSGYLSNVYLFEESEDEFAANVEKTIDVASISDLTVYVGDEYISRLVTGGNSVFVLTSIASSTAISSSKSTVIVDKIAIMKCPFNHIASGYGKLITKLLCVLDYRAWTASQKDKKCNDILNQIEGCILRLFDSRYVYYKDGDFVRDLTNCFIQVAVYESMLDSSEMLHNYDIVSSNLQAVVGRKLLLGECEMIVGWYSFNILRAVLTHGGADLFYPADIIADAELISLLTKRKLKNVVGNIEIIKSSEVDRLAYVLEEYRIDIVDYINGIWDSLNLAMKNYRRIYYDAGLELSGSISLEKLSKVVCSSFCEQKYFSIVKLLRTRGEI